jgi:hypothetical protein
LNEEFGLSVSAALSLLSRLFTLIFFCDALFIRGTEFVNQLKSLTSIFDFAYFVDIGIVSGTQELIAVETDTVEYLFDDWQES